MKITEISIKRPSLVIVVFLTLVLMGLLSYFSLSYELLPKFSPNVVTISTVYPGASPSEVENTVTKKVEDAVSSMENVKKLTSTSFEGVSNVVVELNNNANVDISLNEAQRKVNAILADLPEDVRQPSLNKFSLDDLPIVTLSASSKLDGKSFYDLMDQRISPMLSRVNGVAQVNLIGGEEREIQVNLDASKMQGYGLTVTQVQQMIAASNLDFPTGSIRTVNRDILIRLSGKYKNINELRNLVIANTQQGAQIRLQDVADIQDSQKDVEKIARIDRQSAIAVQIIKQSDANAVEVSKGIKAAAAQVQQQFQQDGVKLNIVNDNSVFTLESADAVVHDLFIAVALVAFVMLFFLHSIRNALIVMVSIPVALVTTFVGIRLFGYTLNLMSLLGLSLVVGILVDDAIVVLENIYRHMEMGKNRVRAAYDATAEIGFTVTAITLVIVVVFFPIAISSGLVSDILRQFCVVIIISTLLSLFTSFTIVPLLSSRFGKLENIQGTNFFGRFILWFEKQLHRFTQWIHGILLWGLANKGKMLLGVLVLFVGSCSLIPTGFIGTEFFPQGDKGEFLVQLEMPKDASIERTNQYTQQAEAFLSQKSEIKQLITTVGQANDGMGSVQSTPYKSEINVKLVDRDKRADNATIYAAKVARQLQAKLVDASVKTVPVSILGTAQNAPIELVVMAPTLDKALAFAEQAKAELMKIPGSSQVKLSVEKGNPEINVSVDRDKMAALGLDMATVGSTMQTAFNGNTDSKFRQGAYEYDIDIRYQQFNRRSIGDVGNLIFTNRQGQQVRLSQFATITEASGASQLERRDKSTSVSVRSQGVGRPIGSIVSDFTARLQQMKKPADVTYVYGGDQENQSEGFGTLGIALAASIILVYFIMVGLYNSFIYPLVVMFSIPLSVIGALAALALTNNNLNIFTILGIIMLIGLVAKNAILLVDFTNQTKAMGKSTRESLELANQARLRPILMTTIAMVIGMLPIALASGAGAEWKNGLAWVIIGGLVSSLFLTLIVVPIVYELFEKLINRFNKKGETKTIDELMVEDYEHRHVDEWNIDHAH